MTVVEDEEEAAGEGASTGLAPAQLSTDASLVEASVVVKVGQKRKRKLKKKTLEQFLLSATGEEIKLQRAVQSDVPDSVRIQPIGQEVEHRKGVVDSATVISLETLVDEQAKTDLLWGSIHSYWIRRRNEQRLRIPCKVKDYLDVMIGPATHAVWKAMYWLPQKHELALLYVTFNWSRDDKGNQDGGDSAEESRKDIRTRGGEELSGTRAYYCQGRLRGLNDCFK
ncbi:hypothetical protein Dimus_003595 [Dionaea muscipula]